MQLIKKIEIRYFRSLYAANLDEVGDINVLFGRNDSGKSNVLRALNLFFNGEVELNVPFDFGISLSDHRRTFDKKFFRIGITMSVPKTFWPSLGGEIKVTKQWSLEKASEPELKFTDSKKPPRNEDATVQKAQLTRLLNQIDFTYVPAIKDKSVFSGLVLRMYNTMAKSTKMSNATDSFFRVLQSESSDLSQRLQNAFDNSSVNISPPVDRDRLFGELDFAHGKEKHSLLRQKGDGIKARYFPEIMQYIDENVEKRFHIWGFEEPENSLDLNSAYEITKRFCAFAGRRDTAFGDTQIFITSHSPVFYLMEGEESISTKRFFVSASNEGSKDENVISPIDDLDHAEEQMERAGLLRLPYLIKKLDEKNREIDEAKRITDAFSQQLADINSPTLFVEGKHDITMFESAFNRVGVTDITIKETDGANLKSATLQKIVKMGLDKEKSLFLFDNDGEGRKCHKGLSDDTHTEKPLPCKSGGDFHVWVYQFTDNFKEFLEKYEIESRDAFFVGEFLYQEDVAFELCKQLAESMMKSSAPDDYNLWRREFHQSYRTDKMKLIRSRFYSATEDNPHWLYCRGVPEGIKKQFAKEINKHAAKDPSIYAEVDKLAKQVADFLHSK